MISLIADAQPSRNLFDLLSENQTGINFQNSIRETEEQNVLSYEYFYNGGGVALGDINNDGLPDLYFTGNMVSDKLYLNSENLQFKDITRQARIQSKEGWKTGVTMADVNADGFLDIYVCYSGNGDTDSRRNRLYINNGNLTFSEKAKAYGLDDPSYSTQAAFFDYDKDGDLDMYLLNHNIKDYKEVELKYLKIEYDSLAGDKLFRNDNNFFTDVSQQAKISGNPISFGLGISLSDLNIDGWMDIYVSNDYQENDYLYINNQDGTFREESHKTFEHLSNFSMGNDIADFNNDCLPDVLTLDMLPEDNKRQKLLKDPENYELYKSSVANGFHHQYMRNMLQLNNGDGTFSEIGQLAGVSNTDWSWSSLFADFDNDGFKDLFITNGYLRDYTNKDFLKYWGNYIVQKAAKMEKTYLMDIVKAMPSTKNKNYLYRNNSDLTFSNVADKWGLGQEVLSNGAAFADLDNDGDLEIITNNVNERAFIYRNNISELTKDSYLTIRLKSSTKNVNAIGAKLYVYSGSTTQLFEQSPVRGFQSSVTYDLHAGLGKTQTIDSLLIVWPAGNEQRIYAPKINQVLLVEEKSDLNPWVKQDSVKTLFSKDSSVINVRHLTYDYNDFKRQAMMPFMYSFQGPVFEKGDINNDGLEDIFIGTSKGQPDKMLIQLPDGGFAEKVNSLFQEDRYHTTTSASFIDADNDHDLDLYTTSGMYHDYSPGNALLSDRLYINDGNGFFTNRKFIENKESGKSCVRAYDYDQDGDEDLFIGGRVVPGNFPTIPKSYFLQNDGAGNFTDIISSLSKSLEFAGMITDARWADLNNDNIKDLIVAGEWMPIKIFINTGNSLEDRTYEYFGKTYSGFWNTFKVDDIDSDGDKDIIAGNFGTNSQIKASETEPAELIYNDFDANGSIDPFLTYYIQGKSFPDASRDMLLDQIYPLRKKFVNYESYSSATLKEVFSEDQLKNAKRLSVDHLKTTLFRNDNGKFIPATLPVQAQFAPVTSIQVLDVNDDQIKDLVIMGNEHHARLKYGRMDANFGMVFLNKGSLTFEYTPQTKSGLQIKGDVKNSLILKLAGSTVLVVGINKGKVITYRLNEKQHEN